jgi:hypothetical protein
MQRFERVVALPDSKLVISLSRINTPARAGSPVKLWHSASGSTAGVQDKVCAGFCLQYGAAGFESMCSRKGAKAQSEQ